MEARNRPSGEKAYASIRSGACGRRLRTANVAASAGHYVTLSLTSHDDDDASDINYTLFDDVTLQ